MMQAVREEDAVKAKQSLHRLLTVALMHHFETLERLRSRSSSFSWRCFDTALDQGADLEELARLKHDFTLEWKDVRNEETLCLWSCDKHSTQSLILFPEQSEGATPAC